MKDKQEGCVITSSLKVSSVALHRPNDDPTQMMTEKKKSLCYKGSAVSTLYSTMCLKLLDNLCAGQYN